MHEILQTILYACSQNNQVTFKCNNHVVFVFLLLCIFNKMHGNMCAMILCVLDLFFCVNLKKFDFNTMWWYIINLSRLFFSFNTQRYREQLELEFENDILLYLLIVLEVLCKYFQTGAI